MDRPVRERLRQGVVDEAVLPDKREPVDARTCNDHLKVVTGARSVDDGDLVRNRRCEASNSSFRSRVSRANFRGSSSLPGKTGNAPRNTAIVSLL
jgi:hypothetical protein